MCRDYTQQNMVKSKNLKIREKPPIINGNHMIQDLDQAETYKYLVMEEGEGVQNHKMKVKIRKEYKRRIRLVLKLELNAGNKIAVINTLAVPIILDNYGVTD